jgi:hypothetical protein
MPHSTCNSGFTLIKLAEENRFSWELIVRGFICFSSKEVVQSVLASTFNQSKSELLTSLHHEFNWEPVARQFIECDNPVVCQSVLDALTDSY